MLLVIGACEVDDRYQTPGRDSLYCINDDDDDNVADNIINLLDNSIESLHEKAQTLYSDGRAAGPRINIEKTKTVTCGQGGIEMQLMTGIRETQNVKEFVYLGSRQTWHNNCSVEISRRIAKSTGVMTGFNTVWKSRPKAISNQPKLLQHMCGVLHCMRVKHGR